MAVKQEGLRPRQIRAITIGLASPDKILEWSHGEVTKPETINYRSFKPEKDGLFCEKIFGPVRDFECHCGKYKRARYRGIVCDRCGVEVTTKAVRRERMGHITLAVPVVHIWYWKSIPSKIGNVLGMSTKDLERIIYYESYVVIEPGESGLRPKELISEEEYHEILAQFPGIDKAPEDSGKRFVAKMGGEAILELLKRVDIEMLSRQLRAELHTQVSQQRKAEILKRLKVIEAFRRSERGKPNRPEWMVLTVIPVIPPELRPLVPLEGGRFATSDLNDLYRRVIIRNNRLKKLIEIKAPEVILRNEKRMLQEAVDSLFDNGRKVSAVRGDGNRPLKSLSDMLRGKQGRFRQNLLGKRIDYSGRSVIVVGPELKLHQCGLPKEMALELFKPFVIRKVIERGLVKTVKSAKKLVERATPEIWEILEEVVEDHPVLLNRAPTLHRLGIQAFQPILIDGKAIQIHPLVCAAFNADFDGDQMAVHVPLSQYAQVETWLLMLSSHNILSPAHGGPLAIPSQDMVLGLYYLTKARSGERGEGKIFSSPEEVLIAYDQGKLGLHARIKVRINGELVETTTGRVIFNQIVPPELGFVNQLLNKRRIGQIVSKAFKTIGNYRTVQFLDQLKDLGFYYATKSGATFGIDDMVIPQEKPKLLEEAYAKVAEIQKRYKEGHITDSERYNQVIDVWTQTTQEVGDRMLEALRKDREGFNPVFMMADSGARGSKDQIRQLGGMRGLMAKPQKKMTGGLGEIIEDPITANFREGLSVLEYFISTHGARKGLADTALKTADAGYLTRRLVDVAQDVVVTMKDCGTIMGVRMYALKEGEQVIEPLADRVLGRVAAEDVFDPVTNEILVHAGELIDEAKAEKIRESGVDSVYIRSVLTCEAPHGVCALCYGRNLATQRLVEVGEAVGVMAAQSIGEPGTQLTLRTFHIGGTAARIAAESEVRARLAGRIQFEGLRYVERDNVLIAINRNGKLNILDETDRILTSYSIPHASHLVVREGDHVEKEQLLFRWDPYSESILALAEGRVEFLDLIEKVTYQDEVDEATGRRQRVVIESRDKSLTPAVVVVNEETGESRQHMMPVGAMLMVHPGDYVRPGDLLAKIPKQIAKTRDITGGLPRVAELFEARRPRDPAIVSEIDGYVKFGEVRRGIRKVTVTSPDGHETKTYLIPYGKHILVYDGDFVQAGEKITEGAIAPQDILAIKGPNAVQEYLVNQIQEVYRLQGVRINDKHIEVITRQMFQKVRVEDPGDTDYLEGDQVDRRSFLLENERIRNMVVIVDPGDSPFHVDEMVPIEEFEKINARLRESGRQPAEARPTRPATFQPVLLGITKASLTTDSFISAASFQETTRVLADAAVRGKVDYLRGLKENVVMGNLIPAGTGLRKYDNLLVSGPVSLEEEREGKPVVEEKELAAASTQS
ncbi:MAG: DNA-directed RNA polymerase subunit beta' [candidate division KSB1 bacterium]|nr:DNA-directed RNA polymerase subunit beta' [candidate division KSB1 bacterium]